MRWMDLSAMLPLLVAGALIGGEKRPDGNDANSKHKTVDLRLPDVRTGKPVALADYSGRKAIVVVFMGTACPINNAYAPVLAKLSSEYRSKGVQFIGINSIPIDTPSDIAEHARKNGIDFPVLKDSHGKVADQFGAQRTPEAFVLNSKREICYRGRIDDQFGYDFRRSKPTRHDLVDALDAVVADKPVANAQTEVVGCLITRPSPPKQNATFTFTRDVAPLLQKHCQECHRPGQIGPMPLLTFEQAKSWSDMIREVVAQKRMPPWFADSKVGHFANDRSLPEKDRDTILAWVDQNCPKGDPKDMPAEVRWPMGWRIGTPDVVLSMKQEFDVPAEMPKGGVPYQYFIIDTNFTEDKWVERAEAQADAADVVHHIIAFVVPPRKSTEPTPPGPPLLPPLLPESRKATVLCGTAPGDMPTILPAGYAKKIPKGAKIVLQMHYTPNGNAQKDRSRIGLIFAKESPKRQVITVPILEYRFLIPEGDANYKVESTGPWDYTSDGPRGLDRDAQILSFMPHMHVRGKDFEIEVNYPDGKKERLLSVPHFNFNWQNSYRLAKPLEVPKGAIIHCTAHFDNSAGNPNNPDPNKAVRWGDQTWQEMMIGWTDLAIERKKE